MAPKHQSRRARGTGTIQRQRDGSYIARTTDRSRSGRFPAGPEGYRQAEDALDLWNKQIGIGANPNESRMKLRDFIVLWLTEVVRDNCRPRTFEFYTRHAGYATTYIGDLPLEAVTTRAIESMLAKVAADGLNPRSVDHVRAVLHNAFNVAHRWYALENPVKLVPKRNVPERKPRDMTPAQVATFLAAVEGMRLCCLYHIALTLGLRRGELLGLRKEDIDLDTGVLHITQQVTEDKDRKVRIVPIVKSDEGFRTLPLPPDLRERIRTRLEEESAEGRIFYARAAERAAARGEPVPMIAWNPDGLLFPSEAGTFILPSNFNRSFAALVKRTNKALKAQGAPPALHLPADLHPHDMRHTALTDLAAHGEAKAVQSIAGHADIETTMKVYAGRRLSAMRDAVEKMEKGRKVG